ncbi:MAG: hypothetical protein KDA33_00670, partial [Phycisphaerales bacterium]|nr:hypothetical protein [Phycisphaerales bacterium]
PGEQQHSGPHMSWIDNPLLPELERFPTDFQKEEALRTAKSQRPTLILISVFLVLALAIVGVMLFLTKTFLPAGRISEFIGQVTCQLLITLIMAYLGIRLWVTPIRRSLRRTLVNLGVPICVPCGYDLRGQVKATCPECGASFDPGLLDNSGAGPDVTAA